MTSKEALKEYKEIYIDKTFKGNECPSQEWYFKIIKQDLERLEKLEKVIEILKRRNVCVYLLTPEEYNFLKEYLNDK